MLKKFIGLISLPLLLLFWNGAEISQAQPENDSAVAPSGTLEKMIVANGVVTMNLQRAGAPKESNIARFNVAPDSFFILLVFNDQLRGPLPSAMALTAQNAATLPSVLKKIRISRDLMSAFSAATLGCWPSHRRISKQKNA